MQRALKTGTQTRASVKDRNETNFAHPSYPGSRKSRLCRDRQDQVMRKKGLHINCSGLSSSWNKCYSKAELLRDEGL